MLSLLCAPEEPAASAAPPPAPKKEMSDRAPAGTKKKTSLKLVGAEGAGDVKVVNPRTHDPVDPNAPDLIGFAGVEFVCMEGCPGLEVSVVRRGNGREKITLTWKTENGNVGKESYQDQTGEITFESGVFTGSLKLVINDNPGWSTESTMYVQMENLSPNAVFGMDRTTVVILNDDPFPQGCEDEDDQLAMIKGYVLHNYNDLKGPSHWGLLYMCWPALQFIWGQFIIMDLLDLFKGQTTCVGNPDYDDAQVVSSFPNCIRKKWPQIGDVDDDYIANEGDDGKFVAPDSVVFILYSRAAFFLINYAIGHYVNFKFRNLKLGGKATLAMRTQMMTQILQLTMTAQEGFPTGKTAKIMGAQIDNAMATTWGATFKLFAALVQLMFMIAFAYYLVLSGNMEDIMKIGFCLIPVIMILFDSALLVKKIGLQSEYSINSMEQADDWGNFIIEAGDLKPLVQTYRRDYETTIEFMHEYKEASAYGFKAAMYEAETLWQAKWFPMLLATVVMVLVGEMVISGTVSVSVFLALFGTANNFGNILSSIFGEIFSMGEGYASIKKMAGLLNSMTNRKEKYMFGEEIEKRIKAYEEVNGELDPTILVIHDLAFTYPNDGSREHQSVLPDYFSLSLEPGQLVAISGDPSCGKNTLLLLMARMLLPSSGFVAFPANWRVRFADGVPRLYDTTIMYNLRFGEFEKHTDDEIWTLCEKLGMSSELLGHADYNVGFMGEQIAYSDRVITNVARCLLSSVDLLLFACTLDTIGEAHAERVIGVLQEMIDNRGLACLVSEIGHTPKALRKPKTVVITSKLDGVISHADSVLRMD